MTNLKSTVFFRIIFKIIILFLSYLYVFEKLKNFDFSAFPLINNELIFLLFIVVFLMFLNWSLETKKWQILISEVENIGFLRAFKSVLIALVFGLFTPNRIGEIGGRAVKLKSKNKIKGIAAASVGSYAQFTVTLILGMIGFGLIAFKYGAWGLEVENILFLSIILIIITAVIIFFFFNLHFLVNLFVIFRLNSKFIEKINIISTYNKRRLSIILIISLLRYIIFVFQYYLLLFFFGINIDFYIAICSILSIFLFMNILPNIVIADLGIRGSVAIFILKHYTQNLQGILSASIVLWLINLMIPAIVGQIFFISHRT